MIPSLHPSLRPGRDAATSSRLVVLCLAFLGLMHVQAATFTWDGSDSNNWATTTNWTGNAVPVPGANRVSIGVSGTSITFANRAIYSAAQGTQIFSGSAADSNRALFIGNGAGVSGYLEINGGVFEGQSSAPDAMGNSGGSATMWINGGTYRKVTGTGTASTFALVFTGGNTLLDIDAGSFEATTFDFQNSTATATTTGTVQLDGGVFSIASFAKTNTVAGAAYALNLNGGTLQARADATWADLGAVTWTVQSSSTIDTQGFSVTIAEALGGAGGISKTGSGTLTLSATSAFAGGLVVKVGTVIGSSASALGGSGAGNVTLGDSSGSANASLLGTSVNLANPITVASGSSGVLTMGNSGTSNAVFSGPITLSRDLALAGNGAGSVNVSGAITGSNTLTSTGSVQLSGNSTGFTGAINVNSGALRAGSNMGLGTTDGGTVVANGGRVELANGVSIAGESLTISGAGGNNFGALQVVSGATATWGGAVTMGETSTRFGAQAGGSLTINGNINAGGFATVIVRSENATTSIVTLGGTLTNLSAGGTFAIFNGIVKLGAADRIQDDAVLQLGTNQSVTLAGTLDLNGFNETVGRLLVDPTVTATQTVTNTSGTAATLTLSSSTSYSHNHLVAGNLGLTKQGSNTVGSSRVDLQACKLEYSIVSPK